MTQRSLMGQAQLMHSPRSSKRSAQDIATEMGVSPEAFAQGLAEAQADFADVMAQCLLDAMGGMLI